MQCPPRPALVQVMLDALLDLEGKLHAGTMTLCPSPFVVAFAWTEAATPYFHTENERDPPPLCEFAQSLNVLPLFLFLCFFPYALSISLPKRGILRGGPGSQEDGTHTAIGRYQG